MNVLMITGDSQLLNEGSGAWERLQLQRGAVERLDVVYWGRGALTRALTIGGAYDVVTAQDPFWRGLVAWFAARKLGASLNIQVHADLSSASLIKRILARLVLRQADSVRVVSENLKERISRMGVVAKIKVLPVFVDIQRFSAISRQPHKGATLLWVGRFEPEKNPFEALRVFSEVQKTVPELRLVMLGEGSLKKYLVEEARGLPVDFPGWRDPLPFLAAADAVLSTSWHESWGSSIVEALAAGVPVVAPDVGIAKEAGAVVVERERLASAVMDIVRNPQPATLKLSLLPRDAWAVAWRESLI